MRSLHLDDIHLGKRLKEYFLIDDQRFVLKQATDLLQSENLVGVFLSGDIYGSSVQTAFVISRSSVRIRKAEPKR